MVDEDLQPILLEANTGPVLMEEDKEDMEMVAGIVDILFGTKEAPLNSAQQGSGSVHKTSRWKELNTQCGRGSTPAAACCSSTSAVDAPVVADTTRRELRVTKLVEWLGQLASQ
jgi:hypothetical protein